MPHGMPWRVSGLTISPLQPLPLDQFHFLCLCKWDLMRRISGQNEGAWDSSKLKGEALGGRAIAWSQLIYIP